MTKLPLIMVFIATAPAAQAQSATYDSGGPLTAEQAAYDVLFTDLTLRVDPPNRSITGRSTTVARILHPTRWLLLDLDGALRVESITAPSGKSFSYRREQGRLRIDLGRTAQPDDTLFVNVAYGGAPRVAPMPPWDGGFTWAMTPSGEPWIATTVQQEGADMWWPTKDHPSDEPDSMALHITVPEPLVVASNGSLRSIDRSDGETTYNWFISTPINSYNVALNIAPYRLIADTVRSVSGTQFPVWFYVLPEDYEKGLELFREILDHLRFFERHLGPYPFRADKYGVAQTPHLGMEHQSIIAYGANFDNGSMTGGVDWGFDALHHHEMSHEWWGNLVTNVNWNDMWLHEGFGTYMQPLYLEDTQGIESYHQYMESLRGGITNRIPVAPRDTLSAKGIYGGDIYSKGAWVLHTLRYLVGEETLRTALRRMAYPTPALEEITDGSHTRFVTTNDFVEITESVSGRDLDWFFEVYVRQPELPELLADDDRGFLHLEWNVPGGLSFPMPVDVSIDGEIQRISMTDGRADIEVPTDAVVEVDPKNWVLRVGN